MSRFSFIIVCRLSWLVFLMPSSSFLYRTLTLVLQNQRTTLRHTTPPPVPRHQLLSLPSDLSHSVEPPATLQWSTCRAHSKSASAWAASNCRSPYLLTLATLRLAVPHSPRSNTHPSHLLQPPQLPAQSRDLLLCPGDLAASLIHACTVNRHFISDSLFSFSCLFRF